MKAPGYSFGLNGEAGGGFNNVGGARAAAMGAYTNGVGFAVIHQKVLRSEVLTHFFPMDEIVGVEEGEGARAMTRIEERNSQVLGGILRPRDLSIQAVRLMTTQGDIDMEFGKSQLAARRPLTLAIIRLIESFEQQP